MKVTRILVDDLIRSCFGRHHANGHCCYHFAGMRYASWTKCGSRFPAIIIRPSNNYGPWQYPEKLIPVVIWKALRNENIPVYAKGENVREWLFVADCVESVLAIMNQGVEGAVYNVGSGEEKRNIDVVKAILRILGKPEELIEFVKDRLGHDFRYSLNSMKIHAELGWKARVPFAQGIEKTVAWYVDHMDWVKRKL